MGTWFAYHNRSLIGHRLYAVAIVVPGLSTSDSNRDGVG